MAGTDWGCLLVWRGNGSITKGSLGDRTDGICSRRYALHNIVSFEFLDNIRVTCPYSVRSLNTVVELHKNKCGGRTVADPHSP